MVVYVAHPVVILAFIVQRASRLSCAPQLLGVPLRTVQRGALRVAFNPGLRFHPSQWVACDSVGRAL